MLLSTAVAHIEGTLVSDAPFRQIAFATEEEQTQFLTFLEKEKFLNALDNPNIACVITTPELAPRIPAHIRGVFVCAQPKAALFEIHNHLAEHEEYVGPRVATKIGKNCTISPLCEIDPYNVVIGDNVTIEAFASIKGRVTIGDGAIIHTGAIIGCKGFSFSKDARGNNVSVRDTARIEIGRDVELFEQTQVSTGIFPWEKTVIGDNTKIDVKCFVAHGTYVGRNCLFAANAICCGNTRIGDNVWLGVNAVVSNRVSVGDGARVSIGAVATRDVPAGETVTGNFAIKHQLFLRNLKEAAKE